MCQQKKIEEKMNSKNLEQSQNKWSYFFKEIFRHSDKLKYRFDIYPGTEKMLNDIKLI